jgi:hypothetical protein
MPDRGPTPERAAPPPHSRSAPTDRSGAPASRPFANELVQRRAADPEEPSRPRDPEEERRVVARMWRWRQRLELGHGRQRQRSEGAWPQFGQRTNAGGMGGADPAVAGHRDTASERVRLGVRVPCFSITRQRDVEKADKGLPSVANPDASTDESAAYLLGLEAVAYAPFAAVHNAHQCTVWVLRRLRNADLPRPRSSENRQRRVPIGSTTQDEPNPRHRRQVSCLP